MLKNIVQILYKYCANIGIYCMHITKMCLEIPELLKQYSDKTTITSTTSETTTKAKTKIATNYN